MKKNPTFQAVVGFLAGGLVWFAVPFGLATTMSLAYHGLSSAQGSDILTKGEISRVNCHNSWCVKPICIENNIPGSCCAVGV